ncbi:MAG TPA: DUF309 domain-containing protein [Thermosynechococcaceae cyanobacterium]
MLPPEFWQGVEQFNQRQFYACHDTLEAIWIEAGEPDKKFYQGVLQVAVGLYHLGNDNWRGAVILLGEGSNRLQGYTPDYEGVDVEDFLEQTIALLRLLQETGAEQVETLKQQLGYTQAIDHPITPIPPGTIALPILRTASASS